MKKWMVYTKRADFNKIGEQFHIDPVVARIIRNRDITDENQIHRFLNGTISDLYNPRVMKDVEKAVGILVGKINEKKPIRIISDYDVDGVMANYVLYIALMKLGAVVDYQIPDRIEDGYGINEKLICEAKEAGIDTIITCDNGIAAASQISLGKELGMTMIVTDHHEVPYEEVDNQRRYLIPNADAVIDPKQVDCDYPYKNLCGAAVAWKLMLALYDMTGQETKEIYDLLQFVAIATVCDVVDLLDENRIIAKFGLELLNHTSHHGLSALLAVNGLSRSELSAYHLGFVIGPCINATGRLDSAELSMKMLTAKNFEEAYVLAEQLKALNDTRKEMTFRFVQEAIDIIEQQSLPKVIVVYLPECHESIAGIIAGRIREKYYRPTFVVTRGSEGLKGSGRSIEGYHMYDEISKCKQLLTKFGGHPMAAGFSLTDENLDTFRQSLNDNAALEDDLLIEKIHIDVPVPIDYLTQELVRQMEILEPFGKANPKPLFAEKELKIRGYRIMGANQNVCKLTLQNKNGTVITAMLFRDIPEDLNRYHYIDCVYYPNLNVYQGYTSLQIIIQDYHIY